MKKDKGNMSKNTMKKLAELPVDELMELVNSGKITEEQLVELQEFLQDYED